MADELNITLLIDFALGTFAAMKEVRGLAVDVAAGPFHHTVQTVGTSEEAMTLGDITPGGFLFLKNHDALNYVAVKSATGVVPLVQLLALDIAWFRLSPLATAPFVQANTAAVKLEILLFSV